MFIDTRKLKRYLKKGFKFAFSQIGLAGLVVGYVILGALIFMKIESSYEKENQDKIEKNREEFFENVRISAETLFNDYLKKNFHTKYSQYRNEEMIIKDDEIIQETINDIKKKLINSSNTNQYSNYTQNNIKFDRKSQNDKKKSGIEAPV